MDKAGSNRPTILVIFGATGDLTHKKLVPALFHLHEKRALPIDFQVVGFSRRDIRDEEYQEMVVQMVQDEGASDRRKRMVFSHNFMYQPGQFGDLAAYKKLQKIIHFCETRWQARANKLFYLAVPPRFYDEILKNLADSGLTANGTLNEGWTRVAIEKPFGSDYQSAKQLDQLLGKLFREDQIYRIDHYLGKETVQNILAFRFSNSFLTPAWNSQNIESIHVQLLESTDVSKRGEFYDKIGALRDVGQNHLLQLLAVFTMSNPGSFEPGAIRHERAQLLKSLKIMSPREVAQNTAIGQYQGYKRVPGVKSNSKTETYFWIRTYLDTPDFSGVPIYLESGKAVGEDKVEVTVKFKHPDRCLCPPKAGKDHQNILRYQIQPKERIITSFWVKKPGAQMVLEEKNFVFDYRVSYPKAEFIGAYQKLLLDVISGNQTLFVSTEEIMTSWKFIDPIVTAWRDRAVSLQIYERGTKLPEKKPKRLPKQKSLRKIRKEIGYIGLGKMGFNMADRLIDFGWRVVAYNRSPEPVAAIAQLGAVPSQNLRDLVRKLKKPRLVWLMVSHTAVDTVLDQLIPLLDKGDVIIDGGNSPFKESIKRARRIARKGLKFLDIGVSGGPGGARDGACLMIGGDQKLFKKYESLFQVLSIEGGYGYMGSSGAGHFVKMVHNGIEYGMMQAIGEGFEMMKKSRFKLDLADITRVYNRGSVIESRLIGWLESGYKQYGENLQDISGKVSHSGEGLWTVETAKEMGIPVPIIKGALDFRIKSQKKPSYTGKVVSALRNQFGRHEVKKKK